MFAAAAGAAGVTATSVTIDAGEPARATRGDDGPTTASDLASTEADAVDVTSRRGDSGAAIGEDSIDIAPLLWPPIDSLSVADCSRRSAFF